MASLRSQCLLVALSSTLSTAQSFNLWPLVNSTALAGYLNVSETFVSAMNTTVNCDADTFRMAGQVDMYFWSGENITTLCTDSCMNSSTQWIQGVYDSCSSADAIYEDTKLVPIDTVAIRFTDGLGLACLNDQQLNITYLGVDYDVDEEEDDPGYTDGNYTLTSYNTSIPGIIAPSPNDTMESTNVTTEYNYSPSPSFCFNESQAWQGIDIPDCDVDPEDPLCSDPTQAMRIANYYNDTLLCSPCFLSVFWWRINSPYLPDTDHSDYLIAQFQDIQYVCNVTMLETIIRISPPGYANGTVPSYTLPGSSSNSSSNATCMGQTLSSSGTSCDQLSNQYGVTTGDLQAATGTDDCAFSGSICVPKNCTLTQIDSNTTCDALAASLSNSSVNVTTDLFLSWNVNIQGLCDSLTEGQYVCTSPPGGSYLLPPPLMNSTNAQGQERGGQGSGSNPDGPLGANGPTINSTAQAPTQPGIAENCTLFAYAAKNDTCYDFSQYFGITLAQLAEWNPILGLPNGVNCSTEFWAGYDYCVQVNDSSSTTTSTTSTTSTATTSLPYPTQSGIDPACDSYAEAESGDYCYKFAQDNNITTDQLYAWNKILGTNGANCSTEFQAGYDYCVGVSTTASATPTSTTPTSTSTTPTASSLPTQSGIASNCDKLVEAKSGDYCYEFAQANDITTAELYEWNTILGPNGTDCSTEFQAGYGYCVAVS